MSKAQRWGAGGSCARPGEARGRYGRGGVWGWGGWVCGGAGGGQHVHMRADPPWASTTLSPSLPTRAFMRAKEWLFEFLKTGVEPI